MTTTPPIGYAGSMTHLTIDVPAGLQSWIDLRLAHGEYADAADYLRDLIRQDRGSATWSDADEDAEMRALVEEGLASGVSEGTPDEILRRVIAGIPVPHG